MGSTCSSSSETCISTGITGGRSAEEEGTWRASAERGITLVLNFLTRRTRVRSFKGMSSKLPLEGAEAVAGIGSNCVGGCALEGSVSVGMDLGFRVALFFR